MSEAKRPETEWLYGRNGETRYVVNADAANAHMDAQDAEIARLEGDKWVSVTSGLPKRMGEYLCAMTPHGYVTMLSFLREVGWYSSEATAKDGYWNKQVGYWKNKPAPPTEEAPCKKKK
jgi:hypothetical protein